MKILSPHKLNLFLPRSVAILNPDPEVELSEWKIKVIAVFVDKTDVGVVVPHNLAISFGGLGNRVLLSPSLISR